MVVHKFPLKGIVTQKPSRTTLTRFCLRLRITAFIILLPCISDFLSRRAFVRSQGWPKDILPGDVPVAGGGEERVGEGVKEGVEFQGEKITNKKTVDDKEHATSTLDA